MTKRSIACIGLMILALAFAVAAGAQESPPAPGGQGEGTDSTAGQGTQPPGAPTEGTYMGRELPTSVFSLKDAAIATSRENRFLRAGILAAGVFPIALLYTNIAVDITKYVANGFKSEYAPWPFKSQYSVDPSDGEKAWRIAGAIGLAIATGVLDAVISGLRK